MRSIGQNVTAGLSQNVTVYSVISSDLVLTLTAANHSDITNSLFQSFREMRCFSIEGV